MEAPEWAGRLPIGDSWLRLVEMSARDIARVRRRVARNIRALAEENEMTLDRLAKKSGVSRSHLFLVLGAGNSPTIDVLTKLSKALKVDVRDLFD